MTDTERNRLLFYPLEGGHRIIPHADILFHGVVFFAGNMYRAIGMVSKTFADVFGVSGVSLYTLSRYHRPAGMSHLCGREVTLPLPGDQAPYYKWSDFLKYYRALCLSARENKTR